MVYFDKKKVVKDDDMSLFLQKVPGIDDATELQRTALVNQLRATASRRDHWPTKGMMFACVRISSSWRRFHRCVKMGGHWAQFVGGMSFNVHQLLRLAKSVYKLDSLWSHSPFIFESGNGHLLKLLSGSSGVPLQVLECFLVQQHLKKNVKQARTDPEDNCFLYCEGCTFEIYVHTHAGTGKVFIAFSEPELPLP